MTHKNEQAQIFYLLKRIDYSQPWEKVEQDLGYDLGDHYFINKECYNKIRLAAKNLWVIFNGFLTENGNSLS